MRFSLDLKLGPGPSKSGVPKKWTTGVVQIPKIFGHKDLQQTFSHHSASEADIEFIKGSVTICDHELPEAGVKVQFWGGTTNCGLSRCWALCLLIDSRNVTHEYLDLNVPINMNIYIYMNY